MVSLFLYWQTVLSKSREKLYLELKMRLTDYL